MTSSPPSRANISTGYQRPKKQLWIAFGGPSLGGWPGSAISSTDITFDGLPGYQNIHRADSR
ncbi:MAG: hypothetical protein LBF22_04980 [Deltaproteobacteria bacterium]|nr:hypothetical protein [Deltaproteobacteria bacterium]